MKTILITSVASPTGYLLGKQLLPFVCRVIGCDAKSTNFDIGEFYQSPMAADHVAYRAFLEDLIERFGIDDLYFCSDYDLRFLAELKTDFFQRFTLPDRAVIELFLDKIASREAAAKAGLDVPKIFTGTDKSDRSDYFARNRNASERPKMFRRLTSDEVKGFAQGQLRKIVLTEFIKGTEYTADAYYDPKRMICEVAVRERVTVEGGVCVQGKLLPDPKLEALLRSFVRTHNIRGFSCTQFIEREGIFYYIETNTRPGGGTSISLRGGLMGRMQGQDTPLAYGQLISRG